MLKPDSKNRHQESQTDSVLCKTLFVSKSELDDLRTELLFKLSELKEEVKTHAYPRCQPPNLALTSPCISSPHSTPVAADLQASASTSVSSEVNLSYPSSQKNESSLKNPSGVSSIDNQAVDNNKSQRTNSRNVVIVGDSLQHRIQIDKMKVGNIPAVKLREETHSVTPSLDVEILLAGIVIDFSMLCYWRGRMIFLIVVSLLRN